MTRWYRYVRHADRAKYEALGWTFAADLGPTHGRWSSLYRWTGEGEPLSPSLQEPTC